MSDGVRDMYDGSAAQSYREQNFRLNARHQELIRNNDELLEQLISKQLEVIALEKLIDQLLEQDSDDDPQPQTEDVTYSDRFGVSE